ncbi:CheR family methyltransferase [Hydrogenobaculum acidophilum]
MAKENMLDDKTLEELRKIIYELTGNYYPDERLMLLTKKFNAFLGQQVYHGSQAYNELPNSQTNQGDIIRVKIEELFKQKKLTKEILDIITVPETKFFREKVQLDAFIKHIVPTIKPSPIKIASYACATGEEVYTLAMMLESKAIPYHIIGFDINETYLEKARQGMYPQRELNDIPKEYHHFVELKENYIKIKDVLKKNIQFKQLNLIKSEDFAPYKDMFDAAFCRNALIYFNDDSKLKAIKNITYTLKMGGYFAVSMTEVLSKIHTQFFESVKVEGIFFYKKIKQP